MASRTIAKDIITIRVRGSAVILSELSSLLTVVWNLPTSKVFSTELNI
uniref:Uncharacterized protein n=1 Tax=Nelumbo nucifera TaxID=4432 RepID=A0A822YC56_NELNU|nr:TPA_asm: hypothetical protein HUJ06_031638 [Nelumbo nucifera]